LDLDGTRLVIHRMTDPGGILILPVYEFVVIDLVTGEEQIIEDMDWDHNGGYKLSGDYLVFMHDQGEIDTEVLSLELSAHMDVIDIRDGERWRAASNIRVPGGPDIFVKDGRFVWMEYRRGGFEARVRAYDPSTRSLETVIDTLNPDGEDAWLAGVGEQHALISRVHGRTDSGVLLGETRSFDLLSDDGETRTVVAFPNTLLEPQTYFPDCHLAEPYVVWTDPYDGELVIYNIETEETRRFDPQVLLEGE